MKISLFAEIAAKTYQSKPFDVDITWMPVDSCSPDIKNVLPWALKEVIISNDTYIFRQLLPAPVKQSKLTLLEALSVWWRQK